MLGPHRRLRRLTRSGTILGSSRSRTYSWYRPLRTRRRRRCTPEVSHRARCCRLRRSTRRLRCTRRRTPCSPRSGLLRRRCRSESRPVRLAIRYDRRARPLPSCRRLAASLDRRRAEPRPVSSPSSNNRRSMPARACIASLGSPFVHLEGPDRSESRAPAKLLSRACTPRAAIDPHGSWTTALMAARSDFLHSGRSGPFKAAS
jgi:hypothetical protein